MALPSLLRLTNTTKKNKETQASGLGFLFYIKWLISWVWPIVIEVDKSEQPELEIVLNHGKKQLHTRIANYSYGNLELAFKRCFEEIELEWTELENALMLGFGVGSVGHLLRERNESLKITGVELDQRIINWYGTHFDLVEGAEVVCADASEFVRDSAITFDLVIVDLYQDLEVPREFEQIEFLSKISDMVTPGGTMIFNKVSISDQQKSEFGELLLKCSELFKEVTTNEQLGMNRFIIAKRPK